MLDERKTAILRAVVQEYIATAQPVGSGTCRQRARRCGSRRPPSATRWRCSSRRATSPSRTRRPAASRPTRATASSSTTSRRRAGSATTPAQQVGDFFDAGPRRLEELLARTAEPARRPHPLRRGRGRARRRGGRDPLGAARRAVEPGGDGRRRALQRQRREPSTSSSPTRSPTARLAAATAHLQADARRPRARRTCPRSAPPAIADTDALCAAALEALRHADGRRPAVRRRRGVDGRRVRRRRRRAPGAPRSSSSTSSSRWCATSSTAA